MTEGDRHSDGKTFDVPTLARRSAPTNLLVFVRGTAVAKGWKDHTVYSTPRVTTVEQLE